MSESLAAIFVQQRPRGRTCGLRFSAFDALVLIAAAAITVAATPLLGSKVVLIPFVVGHFFLFCNVLRIRRNAELIWAFVFVANYLASEVLAGGALLWPYAAQLCMTVVVAVYEMRSPVYHGIFARAINPRIDEYLAGRL